MPTDAIIHLDNLRCLAEDDGSGHSEPYAWTLLIWVDDATLGSPNTVGARAPGNLQGSRKVIDRNMRPGDTVPMPAVQRSFAQRFDDGFSIRQIGVVVTLLEADETPSRAVRAAYDAYVSELPRAIGEFIRIHRRGPQSEAERQAIAAEVQPKVTAAGRNALTRWQKFRVAIGTLNLDDQIDFEFFFRAVPERQSRPESFTLAFRTNDGRNHYELDGRFEVRPPPAPDRCQAELDRLRQTQSTLAGYETMISSLQAELQRAAPAQKPAIIREIGRIRREELPPATDAVKAAEQALAECRG